MWVSSSVRIAPNNSPPPTSSYKLVVHQLHSSYLYCAFPAGDGALEVVSDPISASYRLPINATSLSGNTTIAAGENLNLTCNGEHFIYRQWTRVLDKNSPSTVVFTTDDGRIEVTSDYQLLFRGILPSDEAQYRCTLGNDLGITRVIVNVKVVGKSARALGLE